MTPGQAAASSASRKPTQLSGPRRNHLARVARDWDELLLTRRGRSAAVDEDGEDAFSRLRESLRATRQALGSEVAATFSRTLTAHDWDALEESLIVADVGGPAAAEIVSGLESTVRRERLDGDELRERLVELLAAEATVTGGAPLHIDLRPEPTVILMVGVNGTGKTTTIGKLAWRLTHEEGLRVLLAAADTFRAAATEQLERWAERAGADIVTAAAGSDPGSVAFDAVARARGEGYDVVLVDTAGRLHNQEPLMAELAKVRRVIANQLAGAPHETLLSLDATTGQNGLRQARAFADAVALARELAIPVKLIGIGEALEDLRPFDPDEFARALIE